MFNESQRNFIVLGLIVLWKGGGLKGRGITDEESAQLCKVFCEGN